MNKKQIQSKKLHQTITEYYAAIPAVVLCLNLRLSQTQMDQWIVFCCSAAMQKGTGGVRILSVAQPL